MLKVALAQINPVVGDLAGNSAKIEEAITRAKSAGADVAVFCELCLCGYPPEDLLLKPHFVDNNLKQLRVLAKKVLGITAIVGFVDRDAQGAIYNAAVILSNGKLCGVYHKQELPNYGVFDEKRYFTAGRNSGVFIINKIKVGINICEDIWVADAVYKKQARAGAKVLINLSSSPYEMGKLKVRQALLSKRAKEAKRPLIYVNCVGGQDELVFDGASMAYDAKGKLMARAKQFGEDLLVIDLDSSLIPVPAAMGEHEEVYTALVKGTRDYVQKNGFSKVALGLSGGIDSAIVACIAADALGKENVTAISMPSPYNTKATRDDAKAMAENLGIVFHEIGIKAVMTGLNEALEPYFKSTQPNIAEENIQARIRGNILMAFSNKFGWLILTTGNKSEMATGYCTLYGDMSGGFAPLKDVLKTRIFSLCRWYNQRAGKEIIPQSVIDRPPTAELRFDQTDESTLGAYADLDKVLAQYVEQHKAPSAIAKKGVPLAYVQRIVRLVDINEYKRRQAPPGVKISTRAFGRDWRLPITNKYRE